MPAETAPKPAPARSWGLLSQRFRELFDEGRFEEAAQVGEEALVVAEQRYGPEHAIVATTLSGLSMAYNQLEAYDKAEALARRCLTVNEAIQARPGDMARAHNNLGLVYKEQEKYVEAREHLEKARALWKESGDTGELAAVLNNLGDLDQEEGKYESAEKLFREVIAMEESEGRVEERGYALTLSNLAYARDKQGDQKEARQLYRRSIEILTRIRGAEHPWTQAVTRNLAALESRAREQGKDAPAAAE